MSRDWVDFRAVKAAVGMRELLARHGLAIPEGRLKWRGRCPVHGGLGDDAFHVHLGRNVFHCFACGAGGDVLDLAAALEEVTVREAALRLRDRFSGAATNQPWSRIAEHRTPEVKRVTKKIGAGSDDPDNQPLGFQLTGLSRAHPYVVSRGIEPGTAAAFGMGVYSGPGLMSGRLAIPIHDHLGRLVAYAGRALGDVQPRYLLPGGFRKSRVLYNLHRAAAEPGQTGIVVEGFLDCMRVWQTGHRSVVALMGVAMSPRQQQLLTDRFRRIVLMMDGDAAGRKATRELGARLGRVAQVYTAHLPEGSQPDKASDWEINFILSEASEGHGLFTQTT